jgi:putative chitobiose transport system permease protein
MAKEVVLLERELVTSFRRKRRQRVTPYLFLLPAIILFFVFDYLPSFAAFYYSFTKYDVLSPAQWIGFGNYQMMMRDAVFKRALANSFEYFLIMVPILLVIPLLLAILVNQKLKGMNFFRLVYYLPVITPMIAVAIGWKFIYAPEGLLNEVLQSLHVQRHAVDWLLNTKTSLPAISILESWKSVGYYMVIYLAGLQAIPQDLVEAARIDGANRIRVLWHIYLPQLRPITAVVLILATLGSVQIFTSVYAMTGGGPLNSTLSLPLYIYQKAFVDLNMGYASAMGVVLWVILLVLTFINFKISRGEGAIR